MNLRRFVTNDFLDYLIFFLQSFLLLFSLTIFPPFLFFISELKINNDTNQQMVFLFFIEKT